MHRQRKERLQLIDKLHRRNLIKRIAERHRRERDTMQYEFDLSCDD